ncbi:hypothetical protein PYH37_001596 [Sinorhizobium numidicum]|uniref:Uncharacterized protein n=1 Tax=Sinorhizobium numidicum TaxID=680248 RepID=A0ABY8CNG0_9HYPH|nr:hypothetical protein [Sinorhizobium numidicum]WEX74206.1 hypothetical protein PYH37_001596 [Sinorhizobium numidicum]WEX80191.1 hypothetical protein PYH38_001597 [Sinorhizobium numidicum]
MKHHAIDELQIVAEVNPDFPRRTLSRTERLQRWAELLERDPHRRLSTLHETEYQPARVRAAMRGDGSPISVAFEDPVFRAAGLENDSYGEAKRFFELSDEQLHKVICYCHFGATVSASTAARHIRGMLVEKQPTLFARLRQLFVG